MKKMNLDEYFKLGGELAEGQIVSDKKYGNVKFIKRNDDNSITIEKNDGYRWSISNCRFWVDNVIISIKVQN
jgi:hypothetical protein